MWFQARYININSSNPHKDLMRPAESSQSVVPGPVASALSRNVLEMENLGPQLKPSGSATLELGTEQSTFFFIRAPGHSGVYYCLANTETECFYYLNFK